VGAGMGQLDLQAPCGRAFATPMLG
jgi:hypothetical protein